MGALFSAFKKSELASFEPNFDEAKPEPSDEKLYAEAERLILEFNDLTSALENYEVAKNAVKRAIEDPSSEAECFEQVVPNILALQEFYQFSQRLADLVERILVRLSDENNEYVFSHQALSKQYAELMSYIIDWDFKKMVKSNLQNDLAFYRRCLERQKAKVDIPVSHEHTNWISMMLAQSLPMMWAVGNKLKMRANVKLAQTVAKFSEACRYLIEHRKFDEGSPYYELCLKAMAGSFVLYDIISTEGAIKSRHVQSKKIIKTVTTFDTSHPGIAQPNCVAQLKSLIQFGCPNFNRDASSKIRGMLQ